MAVNVQQNNVGGFSATTAIELTRPADTLIYAAGDALANSTTAASVVPLSFPLAGRGSGLGGIILGGKLITNSTSAIAAVRLWLFNQEPFAAAGYQADNAALALTYNSLKLGGASFEDDNLIGYIDFASFTTTSTSSISEAVFPVRTSAAYRTLASLQTIFGLYEVKTAFTPISAQTFLTTLDIQQD